MEPAQPATSCRRLSVSAHHLSTCCRCGRRGTGTLCWGRRCCALRPPHRVGGPGAGRARRTAGRVQLPWAAIPCGGRPCAWVPGLAGPREAGRGERPVTPYGKRPKCWSSHVASPEAGWAGSPPHGAAGREAPAQDSPAGTRPAQLSKVRRRRCPVPPALSHPMPIRRRKRPRLQGVGPKVTGAGPQQASNLRSRPPSGPTQAWRSLREAGERQPQTPHRPPPTCPPPTAHLPQGTDTERRPGRQPQLPRCLLQTPPEPSPAPRCLPWDTPQARTFPPLGPWQGQLPAASELGRGPSLTPGLSLGPPRPSLPGEGPSASPDLPGPGLYRPPAPTESRPGPQGLGFQGRLTLF